jgi:phage tail sheath protein FI
VRAPGSERIEVQETHRRVSVHPGTQRYIANVLLESKLVRVQGAVPEQRPNATFHATSVHASSDRTGRSQPSGYAAAGNDGDDGAQLTDYDIIGSAVAGTGLFALANVDNLGFLYIPPLARDVDVGASILLVAEKFCRDRRTLLIVDPPLSWATAEQALLGAQKLEFHSEHALMYFPRLIATDRLRARSEIFPNGGAVAGMLARAEDQRSPWAMEAPEPEHVLRSGVRLSVTLNELDHWRFATHGINTLRITRNASIVRLVPRTLAGGINGAADFGYLAPQRLASFVVNSIERGTRWAVWSRCEPAVWPRVLRQVTEFLTDLTALGAFPAAPPDRAFMVVCDQRVNSASDIAAAQLNILIVLAGSRLGHYHGFLITHRPDGRTIKRISVNQLELPIVAERQIGSAAGESVTPLVATRCIA